MQRNDGLADGAGGEPINGCPINLTIVPNVADAASTVLHGLGLVQCAVDVPTNVRPPRRVAALRSVAIPIATR